MARAVIIVSMAQTKDQEALLVKQLIEKALEKISGVEIEMSIRPG